MHVEIPVEHAGHPQRGSRLAILIVCALTLGFAAMTGHRVFTAALWGDEIRTWRDGIEKPLIDVLTWRHHADHAPLGHLMARAGAAAFGVDHAWSLRLGAWLCGIACVPMIYLAGRAITGRVAAGLLMTTMLVVDPNVAFQSAQARMYTALLLATLVALTMVAKLFTDGASVEVLPLETRPSHRRRLAWTAGLAVALAVGIWSHAPIYAVIVPMLFVAIGLVAVRLIRERRVDRTGVMILVAIGVALLLGVQGVLKLFRARHADPLEVEDPAAPLAQLEDATRALTGANWITGLVVVATICGLIVIGRRSRPLAWLLGGIVVMAIANLMIAAQYRPVAFPRYLTAMQPALWACIAALIVELWDFVGRGGWSRQKANGARAVIAVGFAVLCGYEITRTIDVMPAHPLAGPFRDAILAAKAESAPIVVLPRTPYGTYARYYGVQTDAEAAGVAAQLSSKEIARRAKRSPTSRPTTLRTSTTNGSDLPLTVVGVIPVRGARAGTMEDPLVLAAAVAKARGIPMPTIATPDATLRVVRFDFTADGGLTYSDPQASRGATSRDAVRADDSATRSSDTLTRSRSR